VEESKDVNKRPKFRLFRFLEVLLGETGVDLSDVGTKTIWGLSDDLKTLLQDTERETVSWLGGEPQSEVLVRLLEVFNDGLHLFEPVDQQMAIVEHDPVTTDGSTFDELFRLAFHTLTEGQELELAGTEAHIVSKSLHFSLRISSRRKSEYDGSLLSRHLVNLIIDQRRRLDVIRTHSLHDEVLNRVYYTISSEYSRNQQLLELIQAVRITTGHRSHFRLLLIVPVFPLLVEALNVLKESREHSLERVKLVSVFPRGFG